MRTGPFIERLHLSDLALTGPAAGGSLSGGYAVTGRLDVVSDVSEIIDLEVRVDFYDVAGAGVGSAHEVFDTAATEAFHTTAGVVGLPISVPAPAGANSAVLSVPVLVNE